MQSYLPSLLQLRAPAGVVMIVAAVCIAYFSFLSGGFIWDDDTYLTDNPIIKASDGLYRFWSSVDPVDYYPVSNTTLWIEWRLWGMNPAGYRVTNLLLHIFESLLIWVILRKLSIPGAFFAALIFAVHPVNVEAVVWIAQRKDMLAFLFFLLSILCYLKMEIPSPPGAATVAARHSPLWYCLSLAAFRWDCPLLFTPYRHALRLQPYFAKAQYNLANTLSDMDRPQEAIEHYRLANSPSPSPRHGRPWNSPDLKET